MKVLIGTDKGVYKFSVADKTIAIMETPDFVLEQVLLITNATKGQIIYNFADSTLGAILSGKVLTLATTLTDMADTDSLQIFMQFPDTVNIPNNSLLEEILIELKKIRFGVEVQINQTIDEVN